MARFLRYFSCHGRSLPSSTSRADRSKMLRIFFKYKRRLLGELCRAAVQALLKYFQAETGAELMPGVVAVIQSFRKVYEVNPLTCPKCQGQMRIIAFLTD